MHIFHKRQGQMYNELLYFYTITIYEFKHLLKDDAYKIVCINALKHLVDNKLIKIYGYVIMPNHIHLIWTMLEYNGKESVAASFAKFTADAFKKILLQQNPLVLEAYKSPKHDRAYQFWKRDPLAVPLTSEEVFYQKLRYIHYNPIMDKWKLADKPESYRWSSAGFYAGLGDKFGILSYFKD